jgi:hypothetical protein
MRGWIPGVVKAWKDAGCKGGLPRFYEAKTLVYVVKL